MYKHFLKRNEKLLWIYMFLERRKIGFAKIPLESWMWHDDRVMIICRICDFSSDYLILQPITGDWGREPLEQFMVANPSSTRKAGWEISFNLVLYILFVFCKYFSPPKCFHQKDIQMRFLSISITFHMENLVFFCRTNLLSWQYLSD